MFVEFVIQNQLFSYSLEKFAQILNIPCACVFTDRWRLDELAYGIPSDGPYRTNPPSIEDIILSIRIDREDQFRRIHHEEEIDVLEYQILTREIVSTLKPLEEIIRDNIFCLGSEKFEGIVAQEEVVFPLPPPPSINHPHLISMMMMTMEMMKGPRQHGQSLNEKSNEAKVKKDMNDFETINIELEHSVAKLLTENQQLNKEKEYLKKTYKDLYDSIKKTRVQTKDQNGSLIEQLNKKSIENADLKTQIQEKHSIPVPSGDTMISPGGVPVPTGSPTDLFFNDEPTTRFLSPSDLGNNEPSPAQALEDPSWVDAMQEEMQQFKFQNVWVLVDLPEVARIEAIRLFLAFASYMGFMVYQMDVKSAFLYGRIDKEVYVTQPKGFVDPQHPKKVYKVVKALYGLHQAPRAWYATLSTFLLKHGYRRGTIDKTLFLKKHKRDIILGEFEMSAMGELTFFLGLQVQQRSDGIFISQHKYVQEILKKFDLECVRTATTPYEPPKPKSKNEPDSYGFVLVSELASSVSYLPAILATIDETPYTITEDSVRSQLQLADDGGIDDLPIAEIYSGMDNLGYVTEGKLTFYKNKFSPQWRFLVHTILHCLSTKSGSWDQFGSSLAVALICLSDGRKFNWSSYIFKGMVSNIGNAKKFLMYPRFLQTILGIETSVTRQYRVFKLSSKLFANMKLNFEGQPMQLLAVMLPQDQEGEGAGVAAQAVPPPIPEPIPEPMPEPDQPQDHLSTPPRQQTPPASPPSPPRSTQAPPAGHTSGGAEDLITLTALSSVVSTFVQKVNSLETKLKAHKKLFKDVVGKLVKKVKAMKVKLKTKKRKVVMSDSDQEEGGEQAMDLDALIALANVAVTVDSNIPPGGASNNPAASSYIPTDVPTERTKKQLADERLSEIEAARLEAERTLSRWKMIRI
ncbi:putative ribonuclease H-like domain-containing protein [Tanacetum coccineum]